MQSVLTEPDREQILADLTEAHNAISKLLSDLLRRYSAKSAVLTAERGLEAGAVSRAGNTTCPAPF